MRQHRFTTQTLSPHLVSRSTLLMLAALIFVSAMVYVSHINPLVRQTDPAAYYYAGLRIAEVGQPSFCDEKNLTIGPYFTLLGFQVSHAGANACLYPVFNIGLPLLIALTHTLFPFANSVLYLVPALGLIGLVATFLLGTTLFDRPTGLLAAGLLAFNLSYLRMTTEIWSDVPALAFLLLGISWTVRMIERDDWRLGLMSGMALGYAFLIRLSAALIIFPLGLYLWFTTRRQGTPRRALVAAGATFGCWVLVSLIYNQLIFGSFLSTGYDHIWLPFPRLSLTHFWGQSPLGEGGYRVVWSSLVENFSVAGLALALAALIFVPRPKAVLLAGTVVTFASFYSFYYVPPIGLDARFLLPGFPMICLSIAFLLVRLLRLLLRSQEIVLAALLPLIIGVWHLPFIQRSLVELERRDRYVANRVALAIKFAQRTEPNAVFMSREYHDLIILYGQRSALHYPMVATPDPTVANFQFADYERRPVQITHALLTNDVPVYIIPERPGRFFVQGAIEPYPILSAHFDLSPIRVQDDLVIYQVVMPSP